MLAITAAGRRVRRSFLPPGSASLRCNSDPAKSVGAHEAPSRKVGDGSVKGRRRHHREFVVGVDNAGDHAGRRHADLVNLDLGSIGNRCVDRTGLEGDLTIGKRQLDVCDAVLQAGRLQRARDDQACAVPCADSATRIPLRSFSDLYLPLAMSDLRTRIRRVSVARRGRRHVINMIVDFDALFTALYPQPGRRAIRDVEKAASCESLSAQASGGVEARRSLERSRVNSMSLGWSSSPRSTTDTRSDSGNELAGETASPFAAIVAGRVHAARRLRSNRRTRRISGTAGEACGTCVSPATSIEAR